MTVPRGGPRVLAVRFLRGPGPHEGSNVIGPSNAVRVHLDVTDPRGGEDATGTLRAVRENLEVDRSRRVRQIVAGAEYAALTEVVRQAEADGVETDGLVDRILDGWEAGPSSHLTGRLEAMPAWLAERFQEAHFDRLVARGDVAVVAFILRIRPAALTPPRIATFMAAADERNRRAALAALGQRRGRGRP